MSEHILAIDPGNEESGWVIIDTETLRPLQFDKSPNDTLLDHIYGGTLGDCDFTFIEMVGHYGTGMSVGKTVFDTCVWIGRFIEAIGASDMTRRADPELILRPTVKTHHCGQAKAKDSNVTQALVDRFTPGQKNFGKGTKAEPGWFFGFRKDVWAAYALAVYAADQMKGLT